MPVLGASPGLAASGACDADRRRGIVQALQDRFGHSIAVLPTPPCLTDEIMHGLLLAVGLLDPSEVTP